MFVTEHYPFHSKLHVLQCLTEVIIDFIEFIIWRIPFVWIGDE